MPVAAIAVLLVGLLLNLATNAASAQPHWPAWLDLVRTYSWPSLGIFTVVLIGVTVWSARRRKSDSRNPHKVADRLADAVKVQWEYEAEWRRIFNPYALPVKWDVADPGLFISWAAIVKQGEGSPGVSAEWAAKWADGPEELSGQDNDLARVLSRVPTRRVVIMGEPGAGKSVLLVRLVLELVSANWRKKGDPVPVLLPIASWNPQAEDFHSWIVRWLATDPAGLARLTPDRHGMARQLLDAGLILPILDGFDEIPDAVRQFALDKINRAIRPCPGLVLASRTSAYRAAVHGLDGTRTVLAGAAGIELCPLDASVVANYLKESADGPIIAARWDPVIQAFGMDQPPPVAEVLRIPLMVTLARAIYNPRDNEGAEAVQHQPSELLSPAAFPTKNAVETYLFDRFVWAAYRPHPNSLRSSRRYSCTYEQARRWLAFLARNQETNENGTPDIAWWKLSHAAPEKIVTITFALAVSVVAAIGYPFLGFGLGATTGLLTGVAVRKARGPRQRRITLALVGGLVGGAASGLLALAVLPVGPQDYGLGAYLAGGLGVGIAVAPLGDLVAALAGGFVGGIAVTFYENAEAFRGVRLWMGSPGSHVMNAIGIAVAAVLTIDLAKRRVVPAQGLRWSFLWMTCGLGCGLIIGLIAWVQLGRSAGLVIGVTATLAGVLTGGIAEAEESNLARATSPIFVLRRDRGAFLGSWLVFGIALGLITGVAGGVSPNSTGQRNGLQFGVEVGLTNLIVPGLGLAFIQAMWGTFIITKFWLALKGYIPWRLMRFLQDAHMNRGVFRQAGAVYQFRHIDLQRRIADWPEYSKLKPTAEVDGPAQPQPRAGRADTDIPPVPGGYAG